MSKKSARPEAPPHEPKDEGARSFAMFVQSIDQGTLHAELSDELRAIGKAIYDATMSTGTSAKAELVLKLTFKGEADLGNTVRVDHDVRVKLPKPKRSGGGTFWLTKGHNFGTQHPMQQNLPLREVAAPPSARDLDEDEDTEARSL